MQGEKARKTMRTSSERETVKGIFDKALANPKLSMGNLKEDKAFFMSLLPLPPEDSLNKEEKGKKMEEGRVGFIKRGEVWSHEKVDKKVDEESGFNRDVFKVLARAIYGSTKKNKELIRCLYNYFHVYERIEKKFFKLCKARGKNGQTRWIKTWSMFMSFIKNRDIEITELELEIIARLYDVQIRTYEDSKNESNMSIVCTWRSNGYRSRVIDLLCSSNKDWALLIGFTQQQQLKGIKVISRKDNKIEEGRGGAESLSNRVSVEMLQQKQTELSKDGKEEEAKIVIDEYSTSSIESFQSAIEDKEENKQKREEEGTESRQPEVQKGEEGELFFSFITESASEEEDSDSIKTPIIDINSDLDSDSTGNDSVLLDINKINAQILKESKKKRYEMTSSKKGTISRSWYWQKWKKRCRVRERNERRRQARKASNTEKEKISKLAVFDFTTEKLSQPEITLLSKGDTFCIANDKLDEDNLKADIYRFSRKLRLHDLFSEQHLEREYTNRQGSQSQSVRENVDSRMGNVTTVNRQSQRSIGRTTITRGISKINSCRRETERITVVPKATPGRDRERRIHSPQIDSPRTIRASRIMSTVRNTRQSELPRTNTQGIRGSGRNIRQPVVPKTNRTVRYKTVAHTPHRLESVTTRVRQEEERQEIVKNKQQPLTSKRKLPSAFDIESKNRNLVRYNTCIQEEGTLAVKAKIERKDNIPKVEREAIKTLENRISNNQIVITKADKGSGIVVINYDTYIRKGTKYIKEEAKAYTRTILTEEKIVQNIVKKRDKIVKKMNDLDIIPKETVTYCTKQIEKKVTGIKFYYKIHKDSNIETMPLRPLQSCINSPTHHLSIVLTDILQPLLTVKNIPTFIQDTNQLLVRLREVPELNNRDTLISSDVAALYPSIPHELGLKAVVTFLEEVTQFTKEQRDIIKQALELVITENFIRWNDQIYKQDSGVAMGTPVAVAYANIFMHWVDRKLRIGAPYILEHIRYIDDNLFILPTDKLEHLMEVANNVVYPHIRYTYDKLDRASDKGLPFLDTQLFLSSNNRIESRLYTKQTDKHTYLLPSSFHPPHITKNIPAVFSRIRRICSREEFFSIDAAKATEWLKDRGYNTTEVALAKEKIRKKDRTQMIDKIEQKRSKSKPEEQKDTYHIPFIVTYNNRTVKLKKVLKDRQDLLNTCFKHTKVIPRVVYRRQKNISDMFIQKSLRRPIQNKEEGRLVKCGELERHKILCPCKGRHCQKICRCCAHLVEELLPKVKLFKQVTCNSKNLVYIIGCKQCKKMYVGETQQRLKDRLLQHLNNIAKLNQPLYLHFRLVHKPEELTISVLETVSKPEAVFRKVREAWWINRLQTLEPTGFNVKLDCNQIYSDNT